MPRISKSDARILIQTYKDTGGWQGGQTRSIWFSSDDLIDIVNMTGEFGADGMHIYLARYPQWEMPGSPDPAKYVNRSTVVFVPTVDGKDIFDVQSPPEQGENQSRMSAINSENPPPAYDHGQLEP